MMQRALWYIAGVDRKTLELCPTTDKLWAIQLGFSLLLSCIVVFGISFHATGYIFVSVWTRILVAALVALTLFMFDRALYQSDWFFQCAFQRSVRFSERPDPWSGPRRFLRIAVRLLISLGLAWVIAVFLELAIFSDTITEKIARDNTALNQPVYAKVQQYESQLAAEIADRRSNLVALEELHRRELVPDRAIPAQSLDSEPRIQVLDREIKNGNEQEQILRNELRQVEERIANYAEEMNAEQTGRRINETSSGRAGTGPRYQFARQQKELYEARQTALQGEISQWRTRREDLAAARQRFMDEAIARREREQVATQTNRNTLGDQLEAARVELKAMEASRLPNIE